jgi:hypothetical protein
MTATAQLPNDETARIRAESKFAYEARECDDACLQKLADVREATAAYHDEIVALNDGFRTGSDCVASAAGLGFAGIHYLHSIRTRDIKVNELEPDILLYEPQKDGSRRLIGVEYWAPVLSKGVAWRGGENEPPPVVDNPAPMLFGRPMEGPMPGHTPGQPWHYDLHVWLWRHNPNGIFENFNPRVTCEWGQIRYVD